MAYDAVVIREAVRDLGLRAEVDHSPVWGSPFKHVWVFLSPDKWEGPLVQVSPEVELVPDAHADSLIVGELASAGDTATASRVLDSPDELIGWLAARQPMPD